MIDMAAVGRRIQERRKVQGLTQEQLGTELGVSAQAVSKWEKGDSTPDIALLPSLCRTLGMNADGLLGITGGPGITHLTQELKSRLGRLRPDERAGALFTAIKSLLDATPQESDPHPAESSLACQFGEGRFREMHLILDAGFACLSLRDAVTQSRPFEPERLAALRALTADGCLGVVQLLLDGPRREAELLSAGLPLSQEELRSALGQLVEAGLAVHGRSGYRLEDGLGYAWAGVILAVAHLRSPTKVIHTEV